MVRRRRRPDALLSRTARTWSTSTAPGRRLRPPRAGGRLRALQEVVRRLLLPAAPQRDARRRRHLLRLSATRRGARLRLRARRGRRFPAGLPADRAPAQVDEPIRRARAAVSGAPPRPLRRVQPDLRPRHAVRPQDRRPHRVDPDVAAAAGALGLRRAAEPGSREAELAIGSRRATGSAAAERASRACLLWHRRRCSRRWRRTPSRARR